MASTTPFVVEALNKFTITSKDISDINKLTTIYDLFDQPGRMSVVLPAPAGAARIDELEKQLADQAARISDLAGQIFSLKIALENYKAILTATVAAKSDSTPLARALACTDRKPVIGLRTP